MLWADFLKRNAEGLRREAADLTAVAQSMRDRRRQRLAARTEKALS